jgi:pimeloyl-ACP methyl ester carboxylesterase
VRAGFGQFAAAVRGGHLRELEEVFVSRMLSQVFRETRPEVVDIVRSWLYITSPEVLADELDAIAHLPDLRARLRGIPAKVVARVGELDVAAPPASSEELARAFMHAELEVVPRCGHLLLVEDPVGTIASIRRCVTS